MRVNNVLDKRYASFGAGNPDLFPRGQAPRTFIVGIQYFLDL